MYDYLGPRLTDAASRLPSPSISDAIADGEGWHFLRIVRSEPGTPPAFDDIRAQILTAMQRESDDAALVDYLAWLKERAAICWPMMHRNDPVSCSFLLLSGTAHAHNKSISFSDWLWNGRDVEVIFTVSARDITFCRKQRAVPTLFPHWAIICRKGLNCAKSTPLHAQRALRRTSGARGLCAHAGHVSLFERKRLVAGHE